MINSFIYWLINETATRMQDVFQRKARFWSFPLVIGYQKKIAITVDDRRSTSKKSHAAAKQANLTLGCIHKS